MKKAMSVLWLLLVTGCATTMNSYVQDVSQEDARVISSGVVQFVQDRERPNAGPIAIEAPQDDGLLGPEIEADLRTAGYTVDSDRPRHHLRYQVTPLDDGMLLRLSLDGGDAARFYRRSFGHLGPSGPFTSREASR